MLSAVREAIITTYSFRKQFCSPLKIPLASVVDPDWIRIQLAHWIRIRIVNPDPDPRVQKDEGLDVLF